jgi:hypothetical protein
MKIFLDMANSDAVRLALTGRGLETFLNDREKARGPLGKTIETAAPGIGR